jgi:hypothetical protein
MSPRSSWPKGLRIVFRLTVLRLNFGVPIMYMYLSDRGLTFGFVEVFSIANYALASSAVVTGWLAWRRSFTLLVLVESCLNALGTLGLNLESLWTEVNAVIARPLAPGTYVSPQGWYLLWCTIVIGFNAAIAFYVWHYELRRNESPS